MPDDKLAGPCTGDVGVANSVGACGLGGFVVCFGCLVGGNPFLGGKSCVFSPVQGPSSLPGVLATGINRVPF